jgi:hypothetical protein
VPQGEIKHPLSRDEKADPSSHQHSLLDLGPFVPNPLAATYEQE